MLRARLFMLFTLSPLLTATVCREDPEIETVDPDRDGDGFTVRGGDCNDGNPEINPLAEEICDGADNDCDGETDEGLPGGFEDRDLDGFGDPEAPSDTCGADIVQNDDDCDDTNAAVNPNATEICANGVDEDCNDVVDDGDVRTYPDADSDGFGDASDPGVDGCPEGNAANNDDCDDTRDTVNPAVPEVCANGLDDDCNGAVDDGTGPRFPDADSDGFGDAEAAALDGCPEGSVVDNTDCDDTQPLVNPGQPEECFTGIDENCDGFIDDTGVGFETRSPDTDADGHGDVNVSVEVCDDAGREGTVLGAGTDCNDAEFNVNPDRHEFCDELDNDCNGQVDDIEPGTGLLLWQDLDNDGWGAGGPNDSVGSGCPGDGTSQDWGDCNDGDATISPAAQDVCGDSIDQDCDGHTDDGTPLLAYPDVDLDGFGDLEDDGTANAYCDPQTLPQEGVVLTNTDCRDDLGDVNPLAPEVCGNGLDDDCTGGDEPCPGEEHCGTITADEIWQEGTPHRVTCDVYVDNGVTLTIEGGATVYFDPNTGLLVGDFGAAGLFVGDGSAPVTLAPEVDGTTWTGIDCSGQASCTLVDPHISGARVGIQSDTRFGGDLSMTGGQVEASDVGIDLFGSDFFLSGTTVDCDGGALGLRMDGQAGTGVLDGVIGVSGCTRPIEVHPARLTSGEIPDASLAISGNTTDALFVTAGDINASGTLPDVGVPLQIIGNADVTVGANGGLPDVDFRDAEIIVGDNSRIRVADVNDARISIDGGRIQGDATDRLLTIGAHDGQTVSGVSTIDNTIFEGTANTGVLIDIADGDPHLSGNTFLGGQTGIRVRAFGTLDSNDDMFVDQVQAGIDVDDSSQVDRVDAAEFSGPPTAIDLPANQAVNLGSDVVIGADQSILLQAGSFRTTGTLPGLAFSAEGALSVQNDASIDITGGSITFANTGGVDVAFGTLTADGTTFEQGGTGTFDGIEVGGSGAVDFTNVFINRALLGLDVNSEDVTINGLTVQDSTSNGIRVRTTALNPFLLLQLRNNAGSGIVLDSDARVPGFPGVVATGNGEFPMVLPIGSAGLPGDQSFSGNGNDAVAVVASMLDTPTTMTSGEYVVQGPVDIRSTLTVAPGATLSFEPVGELLVGVNGTGTLIADGVSFVSNQGIAQPCDWRGITLGPQCDTVTVPTLTGVTVSHGGLNGFGNIYMNGCDAVIENSTIQQSCEYGIYRLNSFPTLTNIQYLGNSQGDLF